VCSTKQAGSREKDGAGARGKRVASAPAGQRTSRALKSLGKHVRFAEPFHPPDGGNQFTGDYKDFTGGLRVEGGLAGGLRTGGGLTGFTGFRRPVRTHKELLGPVKRVGAIQVFCLRATRVGNLSTGGYRLLRIVDDFSFC